MAEVANAMTKAEHEAHMKAEERIHAAHEEGVRQSQASSDAAVTVAREALSEALGAATAEARAREAELVTGEQARRELQAELIRWRGEAEARGSKLADAVARQSEIHSAAEERVSQLQEEVG